MSEISLVRFNLTGLVKVDCRFDLGALMDLRGNLASVLLSGIAIAWALATGPANASLVNVALTSDGASFVTASSQLFSGGGYCCGGPINGGDPTAQTNLLTATPTPWLFNGDTRFIFDNGDPVQSLIIKLGATENLAAFGATFSSTDRVPGSFAVATSTNGSIFTPYGTLANPNGVVAGGGPDLISGAPVQALYVEYFFGPGIGDNGAPNGVGVSEVFASAVPETSTWAMMILGFAGVSFMTYRRRNNYATAA
jgi:hypothetical protein